MTSVTQNPSGISDIFNITLNDIVECCGNQYVITIKKSEIEKFYCELFLYYIAKRNGSIKNNFDINGIMFNGSEDSINKIDDKELEKIIYIPNESFDNIFDINDIKDIFTNLCENKESFLNIVRDDKKSKILRYIFNKLYQQCFNNDNIISKDDIKLLENADSEIDKRVNKILYQIQNENEFYTKINLISSGTKDQLVKLSFGSKKKSKRSKKKSKRSKKKSKRSKKNKKRSRKTKKI